jgi:hypothetical protein
MAAGLVGYGDVGWPIQQKVGQPGEDSTQPFAVALLAPCRLVAFCLQLTRNKYETQSAKRQAKKIKHQNNQYTQHANAAHGTNT